MSRLQVAIVGSGVAGSLIAKALGDRDDVALTCFERVASTEQADSGTGLNVGPNGIKSLASLDPAFADRDPGDLAALAALDRGARGRTAALRSRSHHGRGQPGHPHRWSSLYGFLRGLVAERLRFESEVHAVRYAADGTAVELEVEEGGRRAGSRIRPRRRRGRTLLAPARAARRTTRGAPDGRGTGPAADSGQLEWADRRLRPVVQRPPSPLRLPRARRAPLPHGVVPALARRAGAGGDQTAGEMRNALTPPGQQCDEAAYVIYKLCTRAGELHWARNQEADPLFRDARGRVLFVGDAAHPMVPTLGQGATSAMEDAVAAVDEMRAALDTGLVDVAALTQVIAARRGPRVKFVQQLSWTSSAPMLAGADPVATHAPMREPAFLAELARVYRDADLARRTVAA